jgi:peptide/nickel transport system substrate-binding protein
MASISPGQGSGARRNGMIVAVVVVIIIIVAGALAAVYLNKKSPSVTYSASISGQRFVLTGEPYNFTINTSSFKSLTIYYGDLSASSLKDTGVKSYTLQHTYMVPGSALIYFTEIFNNGKQFNSSGMLLPVTVSPSQTYVSDNESLAILQVNYSASTASLVANHPVFSPGAKVNFTVGYYTEPVNHAYQIVYQNATVYSSGGAVMEHSVQFLWSSAKDQYSPVPSTQSFDYTFANQGMYVVEVNTTTARIVNTTTGAYTQLFTTTVFLDVAVFTNGALLPAPTATGTYTVDELVQGGYQSLDPAIAFDTVSLEPIYNTMLPLIGFNGSSDTQFVPMLAKNLPSISNGEINDRAYNYTVHAPWGATYKVSVQPYQNYTFYINNNSVWQNGQRVTAWDVMYSYARVLLFDAGSPLTGGWMIAPDLLPAPYTQTNTFWNITQNITVNNATNSITFHLQKPMTPVSLFGLIAFYRITSASWLEAHGAGITWSPQGFASYKKYGSETDYDTYVQNHIFSDGPYELEYTVPGTEVVLTANPNYNPPGPWFPRASIGQIVIKYVSQESSIYLDLKSGTAQQGTIPTSSWDQAEQLVQAGLARIFSYQSPTIFFWKFNANIDMTELQTLQSNANLPFNLFTSENVRKAFAYAFNYKYFLDEQVGNSIYNTTFAGPYAGFLENGVIFAQNYSVMQNVSQVPYFNLTIARNYWNAFMTYEASKVNVSYDASLNADVYNGKPLNIPIFVDSSDPVMTEGAVTWAQNLEKVIPGAQVEVDPLPFTEIIGLSAIQGKDPLPIFEWSLAPAYAYPTDSVGGSEMPTNTSHLGGVDITPYWFNSTANSLRNSTEASQLELLIQWYADATSTANTSLAEMYFHKINELFVNLTICVYTEQIYQYHIISTSINPSVIVPYEENGLLGNDMLFNFLSYS